MTQSVRDFLRSFPSKAFFVQFVISVSVEGKEPEVTQVTAYLLPANSESEARATAQGMMESLSDRYRNSNGDIVTSRCLGVHSMDELTYVDDGGRLQLGLILFSSATRPEHLLQAQRKDLPLLDD